MKTTTLKLLVAGAAFAFGSAAYADCSYPKAPDAVPDGKTATEEQMVKAMDALKDYNTAITEYLACLDKDAEDRVAAVNANGPDAPKEIAQIKSIQNQKHNAAVDELTQHANAFNE